MREINRLRALQMRVAGDEHFEIVFAKLNQCQLKVMNFIGEIADFLAVVVVTTPWVSKKRVVTETATTKVRFTDRRVSKKCNGY